MDVTVADKCRNNVVLFNLPTGQLCLSRCKDILDNTMVLSGQVFALAPTNKPGEVGLSMAFPSDDNSETYIQCDQIMMLSVAPDNLVNIYRQATSNIVTPGQTPLSDILS